MASTVMELELSVNASRRIMSREWEHRWASIWAKMQHRSRQLWTMKLGATTLQTTVNTWSSMFHRQIQRIYAPCSLKTSSSKFWKLLTVELNASFKTKSRVQSYWSKSQPTYLQSNDETLLE